MKPTKNHFQGKRGMAAWQIVMLILAAALFLFFLLWFGVLDKDLGSLLGNVGDLF